MYPVLGSSRFLVVGPVAVMSLMARDAMQGAELAEGSPEYVDAVCFLSVLVALTQGAIWAAGLAHSLSRLLPESAIAGFSSAAAIIIGATQLSDLLGTPKCRAPGGHACGLLGTLWGAALGLPGADPATVLVAGGSLALLWAVKHVPAAWAAGRGAGAGVASLLPKLGSLLVVLGGVLVVLAVGRGEENEKDEQGRQGGLRGVAIVGDIPSGLPSPRWLSAPEDSALRMQLARAALPMALVGFAEATAIAKASHARFGGEPVSEDDELLALAACNAFTAWVGGYPVTGSFSRTAINAESGARSPLSTAIAALTVLVVLLLLTPMLRLLPKAAVAAIVLSAVARLVDPHEFTTLLQEYRADRRRDDVWLFAAVFIVSVIAGPETGLMTGIVAGRFIGGRARASYSPAKASSDLPAA
jgi:SulP family sulfate permease